MWHEMSTDVYTVCEDMHHFVARNKKTLYQNQKAQTRIISCWSQDGASSSGHDGTTTRVLTKGNKYIMVMVDQFSKMGGNSNH